MVIRALFQQYASLSLRTALVATVIVLIVSFHAGAYFSGGNGTPAAPYKIRSVNHLDSIRYFPKAKFILVNDLDLSNTCFDSLNSPEHIGWVPIRNFLGVFDGGGYKIRNIYIYLPDSNGVGLFGILPSVKKENYGVTFTENARIQNLGIVDCHITGKDTVGGIGGVIHYVENCYVSGYINGNKYVGGLGGIAGDITKCFVNGYVNAKGYAGGLAGFAKSILLSYSSAQVTGMFQVGGLAGNTGPHIHISDSYATGNIVTTVDPSGSGLVPFADGINNCFFTGTVQTHAFSTSALTAHDECECSNSFWNIQCVDIRVDTTCGRGATTQEMKHRKTYTGWNFDLTWHILDGISFPGLNWVNNPPVAENQVCTTCTRSIPIQLCATDAEDDEINDYTIVKPPLRGIFKLVQTKGIYTLGDTLPANDTFTWCARDSKGVKSNEAMVVIVARDSLLTQKNNVLNQFTNSKYLIKRDAIKRIRASTYLQNKRIYAPENIFDFDPATCWGEGDEGSGTGAWIELEFATPKAIHEMIILNGYTKSPNVYSSNNRIRELEITAVSGGDSVIKNVLCKDLSFFRLIELFENHSYMELSLVTTIRFTIKSIYKGSEYDDACISEILLFGRD